EAERVYRDILRRDPNHADAWHLLGVLAHTAGQPGQALDYIGHALKLIGGHPSYYFNLGEVYRSLNQHDKARDCYREAVRLNPRHAAAHNNLGTMLQEQGDLPGAEACYRRALQIRPNYALAQNNLGAALLARKRWPEARACLEEALRLDPAYAEAHNNLGSAWQGEGDLVRARACFQQALRLKPNHATAHHNLGTLYHRHGQLAEAQACFREALRLKPDFAEAHYSTGALLKEMMKFDEAQACFERALRLKRDYVEALSMLATVFELQGKPAEAAAAMRKALALKPADELRLKASFIFPTIYPSVEELHRQRNRVRENLARLAQEKLTLEDPGHPAGGPLFFLAYQGLNDRAIQADLAALYARAAPDLGYVAPHCVPGTAARTGPIRIGFLSTFFYHHTIAKLNLGYIRHLSRADFHVTAFRFAGHEDAMAAAVRQAADEAVTLPADLEAARQQIAQRQLDVLFFTDIGMNPLTYFLAFARLAPVQCVTWGHPVTTGIPTVDYFLSSTHLEPEDAEDHYTERLIRLPHLNTYYHPPRLSAPIKTRRDFGLPEDSHLYVCPQTLFKIHPEFDPLLAGILRADPKGLVVFLAGMHPHWAELLTQRLRRSMPAEVNRVRFLPQQSGEDFLHLEHVADALLDPIHFGGGNTSLEAFAVGTPVVTLAGQFLRSRITYACYRQMGLDECIARDAEDYVRIAVRLGTDPAWRQQVRARIEGARHVLFENPATVRELEGFLIEAVKRGRAMPSD
ncbi:MAG: tetratricopeptide repeat protein, partial [Planctomycetes bacterium]|nr:tetratricopeptide repeat protein [Planctomycetota bacterium]